MWRWNWLEDFAKDLRHTGRMLAANPGFTAIAIVTLALGIGANSAIFSVVNALLLQTLPVHDPRQVYRVHCDRQPANANSTGDSSTSFSDFVFQHLRHNQQDVTDLVAYVPLGFNKISVRAGTTPEEASVDMVSGNFFSGLGVHPFCGRVLSPKDESTHAEVAVISYGYANLRFGESCSAVGRPIVIKGVPFTIVGVAANGFTGVEPVPTGVWVPFQVRPELNAWGTAGKMYSEDPNWWCLLMIARLKPGVTTAAAEAALNPPFQHAAYEPLGGKPARGEKATRLHLVEARGIADAVSLQKPLLILQVMVGLLLVIACGNLSVLLAVRNAARRREFSVRVALGCGAGRLFRQLLAESVTLVFGGTLLGLLWAAFATRVLARWAELETSLAPDRTVLLFTLAVSTLAALAFGIAPAIGAARISVLKSLKTSSATAYREASKFATGKVTVAVQLALCLTLLTGTGLLVRTLRNLENVDVGFPTGDLLVFGVGPHLEKRSDAEAISFYRGLTDRLRSLPQVESVTLMGNRIASGWSNNTTAVVDGQNPLGVSHDMLRWNNVGPGFFTTLGIPVIEGRDFTESDSQNAPLVAIVNRTFVQSFLKDSNPIGHTASFTPRKSFTIVGVVRDSKYTGIEEDPVAMAWFPYTQVGEVGAMDVELRIAGPPAAVLPGVRKAVADFAPDLALLQPRTQRAQFDETIASQRLVSRLSLAFAVLAIVLVCTGLYGTVSFNVTRRTSELGIRIALGAARRQVLCMVLREGLVLGAAGLIMGLPLVMASSRIVASLLYGVAPADPISIAAAAIGILGIAALASYLPARRAASVDPMVALRYE